MRRLVLFLLLGAAAWAGPGAEAAGWIGSLSGVTTRSAQEKNGRYQAVYSTAHGPATLDSIRAGLMRRGWMVDTASGAEAFRAKKSDLRMEVSLQGEQLTVQVLQAARPGQGGTVSAQQSSGSAPAPPPSEPRPVITAPVTERILNDNHLSGDIQCQGGEIILNGNDCVVRLLGQCSSLVVNGSRNTVSIPGKVDNIQVNGTRNQVLWSGYANPNAPSIVDEGQGNRVERN